MGLILIIERIRKEGEENKRRRCIRDEVSDNNLVTDNKEET